METGVGSVAEDQEVDGQPWAAITMLRDNDEAIALYQVLGQLNDARDAVQVGFNARIKLVGKFQSCMVCCAGSLRLSQGNGEASALQREGGDQEG